MRKILFAFIIISLLLLLTGCRTSGKAIEAVQGGPEIQADTYLERAETQLNTLATALSEGKMSAARDALDAAGAYIINADSAISKIPYTSARDGFKIRYDSVKQRYDFLKAQIQ
jgi:uncharacterized protein YceK